MKASELLDYLKRLYKKDSKTPILLLGSSGIGKSETVRTCAEELAQEFNKKFVDYSDDIAQEILEEPNKYFLFVDFRLTEVEPSDLIGIPRVDGNYVRYYPMLWARCLQAASGILFLDERCVVPGA